MLRHSIERKTTGRRRRRTGGSARGLHRGLPRALGCALFAVFVWLTTDAPVRAADPCSDVAHAIAALKEGDRFQETTELFAAARRGCETEAQKLLDLGAAIEARDREGATALARAAEAGKLRLVNLLLSRGANVNARAVNGSTPLFYATQEDRANIVGVLLDHGADPNLPGRSGLSPIEASAYNDSPGVAKLLLQHGAKPDAVDESGKGAMVYAAGRGNTPVVALLLDAGVDVNQRYGHNLTALMWAAGHDASAGSQDIEATVKLLLARGAKTDLKDDRGMTAADIARSLGYDQVVSLLAH